MDEGQIALLPACRLQPQFCQYVPGSCDQDFKTALQSDGLFLFPSAPVSVANTIEESITRLTKVAGDKEWKSWKNLEVPGQIIFCEICKAM